jgi:hypothetical protein
MNCTTTNSNPVNESPVLTTSPDGGCKHPTLKGRCRMPVADTLTALCADHARRQHKQDRAANLAAELIDGLTEFNSAIPINEFLNRLLVLVTKGRVSARRAAVLAYITNQLLHSHRAIKREIDAQADEPQQLIFDMPRPDRD